MTAFDYAVLTVILLSAVLGVWRGVVGEILALVAWIAAFFAARTFAGDIAPKLVQYVPDQGFRLAAAYALIFVGVLLLFWIGRMLVSLMLKAVGLGLLDRLLGACFGVLRGMVLVFAAVMVAGMTPLPSVAWWRDAILSPPLETAVLAVKPRLPPDVAKRIRFR